MTLKINLIKAISYLITKLAGAGFLLFVISIYLLLSFGKDMYEFVEGISSGFLWIIVFGYGILCSLLIDLWVLKVPNSSLTVKILLYILAGYGFFIITMDVSFMLFAGTIGALCSLIFYVGTLLSFRFQSFKYVFSIVVPLIIIILMDVDFTEKEQWIEVKSETSYTATFDHFNGKHEIPILAKSDQTITLSYDFNATNDGGHGFYMLNGKNKLVGLTEVSEEVLKLEVQKAGVYRMVVTGDDVKGNFKVKWSISETY